MANETKPTIRVEEYLESILNMLTEGKPIQAARLAQRLGLTLATVTATLKRMKRDGLVTIGQRKEIHLSENGRKWALTIVRRHRLVERLLTDIVGVPWYEAHDEACLMEHGISDRVEERLFEVLGRPDSCPHGNPVPRDDSLPMVSGVPLDSVSEGTRVRVERVSEEAERNVQLLEFLHRNGIIPGATFTLKEVASYAGMLTLAKGEQEVAIGTKLAAMVWVSQVAG